MAEARAAAFAIGWKRMLVSTSVKPLSKQRQSAQRSPSVAHGTGVNVSLLKDVGESRAIVRIVEIHVEISFQFEPVDREIVAAGLQTVAHADARDRPVIDRIDRSELREIDRPQLGRRLVAIELQDRQRIGVVAARRRKN